MMNKLNAQVFKALILFSTIITASSSHAAEGSLHDEHLKGFLWYNEEPIIEEKQPEETITQSSSTEASEARQRNQQLSQKLDDAIQVMADNPTVDNAVKAQRLQKQVMDRSEKVSESWALASLLDAGLIKAEDNQNVLHRALQKEQKQVDKTKELQLAANDWGIFFYWMEHCVYCAKFVPIVKDIQQAYGFQVLALSEHGGGIGPFEGKKDTGIIDAVNPDYIAPMLFLVNKNGQDIYPIARGLTDAGQVTDNILTVVKYHKEQSIEK